MSAANSGSCLERRSQLNEADRQLLLSEWNATSVHYNEHECVPQLFLAQTQKTPDAIALSFGTQTLTYAELEDRSRRLACYLAATHQIGRDSIVALFVDRSIEMIVSLLATLRAGAAYLPLDPSYPPDRLAFMLADARPKVVLTTRDKEAQLPTCSRNVIRLDADFSDIDREPATQLPPEISPDALAYVIYTSGSTGTPKGVAIPHRALTNHMHWMRSAFPLHADDVVLQKTPFGFDASVWEILAPLIQGAKLVMAAPGGHKDPTYLTEIVRAEGVTTLQLVPSMLDLVLQDRKIRECSSLRNVFSGGEALKVSTCKTFFKTLSANLHNLYGPTETCIQSVVYSCRRDESSSLPSVPIGRPIWNTELYVLDDALELVPIGSDGELYIGGEGLARGYLGLEELTHERFVPHPFNKPGLLYRTGDVVRYRQDGNLEYRGRLDDQVKVGGQRVELGEIEATLINHPSVREAAVVAVDDPSGGKRLAAFVVNATETALDTDDLKRHLAARLPSYMLPTTISAVERLPRLPSGKIDRSALSKPTSSVRSHKELAPMSSTELLITELCCEVLQVSDPSPDDDFFELGGGSLQLLYVLSQANARLHTSIGIDAIRRGATISAIASCFETARGN